MIDPYRGYEPPDSGGGYTCPDCHIRVHVEDGHVCSSGVQYGYSCYSCPECGQAVHGDRLNEHVCSMQTTVESDNIKELLRAILEKLDEIETAIIMGA